MSSHVLCEPVSTDEDLALDAYEDLRQTLFSDSAVAGEASGYSMGLVMLGSGSTEAIDEMLQYAHETQHEKIIRGLAVGIAFICYGQQEQADSVIDRLLKEKVSTRILTLGINLTLIIAGSRSPIWRCLLAGSRLCRYRGEQRC